MCFFVTKLSDFVLFFHGQNGFFSLPPSLSLCQPSDDVVKKYIYFEKKMDIQNSNNNTKNLDTINKHVSGHTQAYLLSHET
mmetsp:Transcript_65434/g.75250  ORF Transcript_65434/g.75250 Transcript_65434/m.75250 type:complete len:81 (+) Transcript_65434:809-1051(+)